jgi:ribose transport system permease protein
MKRLRAVRELSTVAILIAEVLFFAWYLWPDAGRAHPFLNAENALLILKYSSIYGIAAVGAAVVIISGGIDLAPGAVIALSGVVTGYHFVAHDWALVPSIAAGLSVGVLSGLLTSLLIVNAKLPPFIATLGMMGITRGIAFIITEGQYYDVSSRLPAGWRPLGVPIDWLAPIVMFAMALIFQVVMTRFQWGRSVFSIGATKPRRSFPGLPSAASRRRSMSSAASSPPSPVSSSCSSRARGRPTLRRGTSWISSLRR